ncbi:MAG: hypothetical protein ACTSVI_08225 [Promethearchaeota archaeon]
MVIKNANFIGWQLKKQAIFLDKCPVTIDNYAVICFINKNMKRK